MTEHEIVVQLTKCISRFSPITARAAIRCNFKCEYCGRFLLASIEDYDTWQWDHLKPIAKRGEDTEANGVIACKLCNFMKRDFVPSPSPAQLGREEYIAEVRAFLKGERQKKLERLNAVRKIAGYEPLGGDQKCNAVSAP
jgi:hypothetical protein